MPLPKKDAFLNEVLSYIKFPYDKKNIRLELEGHISDRMDDYIEEGYDEETAEQLTIENMGVPKEIGIEMNKQHNPFLGWIWLLTKIISTILVIINIYFILSFVISLLINKNFYHDIPKSNIVYQIDINEKVKIDDTIIHFTKLIYDTDGDMNIFYISYSIKLLETGWQSFYIGDITDNLGNTYISGSGIGQDGLITKAHRVVHGLSSEADTIIISYELYNRKYQVKIPLKAGNNNE